MGRINVQVGLHLLERALGLREEVVDDRSAEVTFFFVIVHFEDLK